MTFISRLATVIALVALGTSLGVAQTTKAPDLAAQLDGVTTTLKGAMLNTRLEIQNAELKMRMDDRVACVGMGRQACARMKEMHAIQGPYNGNPPTNAADFAKARTDGEAAFKEWVAGKAAPQKDAGKKLYVAWLTMIDGLAAYSGDPYAFDNAPAGVAWNTARNQFQVDQLAD